MGLFWHIYRTPVRVSTRSAVSAGQCVRGKISQKSDLSWIYYIHTRQSWLLRNLNSLRRGFLRGRRLARWGPQYTTTHCNTLQHTATHCNTLQYTATNCNTLQYTATHCHDEFHNTLQHTATHCNTLQHTAIHCNTLQHTVTLRSAMHCNTLQHTTTHCNTLQHTTTHYNTLQHTTTHYNTLQLTATHCNRLQHTTTHCHAEVCNALQYTAAHCNILQHTATHCNALHHTATHTHRQAPQSSPRRQSRAVIFLLEREDAFTCVKHSYAMRVGYCSTLFYAREIWLFHMTNSNYFPAK